MRTQSMSDGKAVGEEQTCADAFVSYGRGLGCGCRDVAWPHRSSAIECTAALKPGPAGLISAGPLAFDRRNLVRWRFGRRLVVALDTAIAWRPRCAAVDVQGVDERSRRSWCDAKRDHDQRRGGESDPKNVYLSASRGRGPDATPLVVRVDAQARSRCCRSAISTTSRSADRCAPADLAPAAPVTRWRVGIHGL